MNTGAAVWLAGLAMACLASGQDRVSIPTQDGGMVIGNLYGKGARGVVLAHGGRFNKESWEKQAHVLEKAGFRVLAIDFRGYGESKGPGQQDPMGAPLHLDVLAAVRYLHGKSAKTVSVVGGSMGGSAGADAMAEAAPGEIERLVMLGAGAGNDAPEKIQGRKLLIVAREDSNGAGPRLPGIEADFRRMPEPKRLWIVEGSAHAQFLFQTPQGDQIMSEIVRFLSRR